MARPRAGRRAAGEDTKSARTRARILDAAAGVLDRHGYAGTRLADIADIAQVQAPALYYYFPSRDALVEEVVVSGQRTIIAHVTGALDALAPGTPPLERLTVAVAAHLEVVLENSTFSSAALRNAWQLPASIRQRLVEGQREYGELWRGLVADANDAGDLADGLDPALARLFVLGALNWTPQWFVPERGSLETLTATVQRFVVHGLTRELPAGISASAGQAEAAAPAEAR